MEYQDRIKMHNVEYQITLYVDDQDLKETLYYCSFLSIFCYPLQTLL